jgi:hypothetical protein
MPVFQTIKHQMVHNSWWIGKVVKQTGYGHISGINQAFVWRNSENCVKPVMITSLWVKYYHVTIICIAHWYHLVGLTILLHKPICIWRKPIIVKATIRRNTFWILKYLLLITVEQYFITTVYLCRWITTVDITHSITRLYLHHSRLIL